MASDSKEKFPDTIYETKDDNYTFDRSPSAISNVEDEGGIQFDQKGIPSDPEQYATWRRGITKLDWRAVPPLSLLWLSNFIDRVIVIDRVGVSWPSGDARKRRLMSEVMLSIYPVDS